MKYVKMFVVAALAAAALMAIAGVGSAAATVLCSGAAGTGPPTGTTCPAGHGLQAGADFHAVSEANFVLTTEIEKVECTGSTYSGKLANEGNATETVKINIEAPTFTGCNCEVEVLEAGTLEVHWIENTHNGTLTWNGGKISTTCGTIFGSVHCIYVENAIDVGALTGSATTGATATIDYKVSKVPRETTSALCSETAEIAAKYTITSPDTLNVSGHT